jgi:hypothetical protein
MRATVFVVDVGVDLWMHRDTLEARSVTYDVLTLLQWVELYLVVLST